MSGAVFKQKYVWFIFQGVTKEFPEKNHVNLARILADIVDNCMLFKITRDNYHIIPFNADPDTIEEKGGNLA